MHVTVLGCSGSTPGPNAPASGYLVAAEGFTLAVDLGSGTLAALQSLVDPFSVDALLLSHLHADHCADFVPLTVIRRYRPDPPYDPRSRRLPVYASIEAPCRFAAAYAPCEAERAGEDLSDVHEFHPLGARPVEVGPFTVTAHQVDHPCDAYGFRIDHGGVTLVYSGDTAVCPELDVLARGADVLLCEASWTHSPDRPPHLHLSGRQAGELAARADVGRLLLTHVQPWSDESVVLGEAESAFGGDTELVRQGARYCLTRSSR